MSPRISLITTAFNAASSISYTLDSVLSQKYNDFEHIIIDAKSSDETLQIIESYRPRYEKRGLSLIVISQSDKGIYDGMNKGLKYANGDIIGFLNADDFFASNDVLDFIAWGFDRPDNVQIIYANITYINAHHKPLRPLKGKPFSRLGFMCGFHPPHPSFYAKKRLYEQYGNFNLKFNIAADYELMLRFLYKYALKSFYIDKCFVKMRVGGASNVSLKNIFKANLQCAQAWRENHLSTLPLFILLKPLTKLKDRLIMLFRSNGGGDRVGFIALWYFTFYRSFLSIFSPSLFSQLAHPYFALLSLFSYPLGVFTPVAKSPLRLQYA
ncbi:glycosyltransferase family 2 protein [uncultured Helicobacter sp.]|uniref:glycosyltransferase family 2 protein n=1 Tax=uncultured Helicobacter sp. TaxID=175537 RepID=UPI00272C527F|nr:glycosyltransferase family 2 protein [uncultured Helicobacter sp.]